MSTFYEAAIDLARRGHRVFPLRPYGKKPAIDSFPVRATTDEAQLRAWWTENPNYNPGVLTTDTVVVDIDVKKGDYAVNNYELCGGHYETFVVRTATGGYHAYYNGPDSKLAVDIVPGVDIRSHNGYVVGPGSYVDPVLSQDPDVKSAGWYTIHSDKQVAWIPTDIERLLEPPGKRLREDYGVEYDTESAIANATAWAAKAEPAVWGAGGDQRTYDVCAKLVRDYALTDEAAYFILLEHWNPRCQPNPWPPEMLWTKVQNASQYGQGALGTARVEHNFGVGQIVVPEVPKMSTAVERGFQLGNLLDPDKIPPRPWLVQRLLLRGDVTVLAAPGAGGKSAIMLTIAAHWAAGKDFGSYKLATPGVPLRMIVYNAEDDIAEQSRRMIAICTTYNLDYDTVRNNICAMDDSQGELTLCTSANRALATHEQIIQYLIDAAKEFGADIIMLDPLVNVHTCNENDNGEMRFVISTLRRIGREAGCAIFVAHHTTKGASSGHKGDAEGIRGAGSIINSSRIAVMLSRADDKDRQEYGIKDSEKYNYIRIDDAKANMFLRTDGAIMWLRWQSVGIKSGDRLGVPVVADMDRKKMDERDFFIEITHSYILANGRAGCTREDIVRVVKSSDGLYKNLPDTTIRSNLDKLFINGVQYGNDTIILRTVDKSVKIVLE